MYVRVRKITDALAGSCAEIWAVVSIMTGNRSTRATDPGASFHRFSADKTARARWIANLQLGASEQLSFLSPDLRAGTVLFLNIMVTVISQK